MVCSSKCKQLRKQPEPITDTECFSTSEIKISCYTKLQTLITPVINDIICKVFSQDVLQLQICWLVLNFRFVTKYKSFDLFGWKQNFFLFNCFCVFNFTAKTPSLSVFLYFLNFIHFEHIRMDKYNILCLVLQKQHVSVTFTLQNHFGCMFRKQQTRTTSKWRLGSSHDQLHYF